MVEEKVSDKKKEIKSIDNWEEILRLPAALRLASLHKLLEDVVDDLKPEIIKAILQAEDELRKPLIVAEPEHSDLYEVIVAPEEEASSLEIMVASAPEQSDVKIYAVEQPNYISYSKYKRKEDKDEAREFVSDTEKLIEEHSPEYKSAEDEVE